MRAVFPAAERVNFHQHRLVRPHVFQLRFLEIGNDPDFRRHDGHQLLADLNIIAGFDLLAGDAPVARRINLGVGQIQLRRLHGGLRLSEHSERHADRGFGRRLRRLGLVDS